MGGLEEIIIDFTKAYKTTAHEEILQKELRRVRELHKRRFGKKCKWDFGCKEFGTYCMELGLRVSEYISNPLHVNEISKSEEDLKCFLDSLNNKGFLELLDQCRYVNLTSIDKNDTDDTVIKYCIVHRLYPNNMFFPTINTTAFAFNATPYVLITYKMCINDHKELFGIHERLGYMIENITEAKFGESDVLYRVLLAISIWRKYIEAVLTFVISIIEANYKKTVTESEVVEKYDDLGDDIDFGSLTDEEIPVPEVKLVLPKDKLEELIAMCIKESNKKHTNASKRKTSS